MAKKRPLVVSFRRIQKMTPNNFDNCDSVSICDIHRLDTRIKDNNEATAMKVMSKCGSHEWRIAMQKSGFCKDTQSCRNLTSNDKQCQKSQLDSLFDEKSCDRNHNDKGCIFPKEKFYGNAKLLLTMNDDILRTSIIDCDDDSFGQRVDKVHNLQRNSFSTRHLKREGKRDKSRFLFKSNREQKLPTVLLQLPTITSVPDDNTMIDEAARSCKEFFKDDNKRQRINKQMENGTKKEAFGKLNKSSSAPSIFLQTKLSSFSGETKACPKSVSMLKIRRK